MPKKKGTRKNLPGITDETEDTKDNEKSGGEEEIETLKSRS